MEFKKHFLWDVSFFKSLFDFNCVDSPDVRSEECVNLPPSHWHQLLITRPDPVCGYRPEYSRDSARLKKKEKASASSHKSSSCVCNRSANGLLRYRLAALSGRLTSVSGQIRDSATR